MIGDRSHDIVGAKKNGMDGIGVLYGYGSRRPSCSRPAPAISAPRRGRSSTIFAALPA